MKRRKRKVLALQLKSVSFGIKEPVPGVMLVDSFMKDRFVPIEAATATIIEVKQ